MNRLLSMVKFVSSEKAPGVAPHEDGRVPAGAQIAAAVWQGRHAHGRMRRAHVQGASQALCLQARCVSQTACLRLGLPLT